jgi:MFS family permease
MAGKTPTCWSSKFGVVKKYKYWGEDPFLGLLSSVWFVLRVSLQEQAPWILFAMPLSLQLRYEHRRPTTDASKHCSAIPSYLSSLSSHRKRLHNFTFELVFTSDSFGGFEYGYQQGVLGQSLVMTRFKDNFPSVVESASATGWLTSILQLGGILGSLSSGVFGEVFSRKYTMFSACCWVVLGSYLYIGATHHNPAMLYAGRFFTGIGVGTFSGVGPLYNAEIAPPELRGLIVSFYQFATILGIMLSFWIGYGSNYIGGIGEGQSNLAWMLPSIIQGVPAAILAVGIWWLPFSPRWLIKKGRDEEGLNTLSYLRKLPVEHELIQVEFLEIKSEVLFERRNFQKNFPNLAAKEAGSVWVREFAQYYQIFRTWDNFKRVATAWLVMFFQQWSGT